jgi:tetratricopeptide (TPR) repeat protein
MHRLRINQTRTDDGLHRVQLTLESPNHAPLEAVSTFAFVLADQDREDLRWYLEDYLQYPLDPAPTIAARIEQRIADLGEGLFREVFQSSEDARDLWAALRPSLPDTRVEITTSVQDTTAIPWELLRDSKSDVPLALRAQAFVRTQPQTVQPVRLPEPAEAPIRILLVICRPNEDEDVPFRSVATHLIRGLSEDAGTLFQLDVLRPPTFARLGEVLRAAKAAEKPYQVVHFDGHGCYGEAPSEGGLVELVSGLTALVFGVGEPGPHGFLLFEQPDAKAKALLVRGKDLGSLLVETGVPVLVLNACRSAHADVSTTPDANGAHVGAPFMAPDGVGARFIAPENPHDQVRAFGSLAQEVLDQGVAAVLAWRYNVYVVTAAQFVADFYAALTQGHAVGEAATLGRKQLHDRPLREIAFDPRPLQDWCVPVVYEAAPIPLFPRPEHAKPLSISLRPAATQASVSPADGRDCPSLDPGARDCPSLDPACGIETHGLSPPALPFGPPRPPAEALSRGQLDTTLPRPPDVGFIGRDETLLALDRAFDTQSVVLLHAYAGSGKTTAAAEFARWYSLTGGVEGPVLFTSFEQHRPLPRVLDEIERIFGRWLEQSGIHWLTLDDDQRRDVALQVLRQVPVLWVWDNVEPVAGFPTGTPSAWTDEEQRALADFLRDARDTRAKLLLTSRRDEQGWLGDLPRRVTVPPMPFQERVLLARALAEKRGRRVTDVQDWRPLLDFTQGNPLTIPVVVGQALRDGLTTREQIEAFVEQLRQGQAKLEDDESQGRTRSLAASLNYGFDHAFTDDERKILALLHLFQGFVAIRTLGFMGAIPSPWSLAELRGRTPGELAGLLDRAAEVGLLTADAGGYYAVHPALSWFLRDVFDQCYAGRRAEAEGAFVQAMGTLGERFNRAYAGGDRDWIADIAAEEANLLHARLLARAYGRRTWLLGPMQALCALYGHTGQRARWARLVEEILPDFVDPVAGGPLPGCEEEWSLVTEYRERLAIEARDWPRAERLQRARVDWERQRASPALQHLPGAVPETQIHAIRCLAVSLESLGHTQRELHRPDCVTIFKEALELAERIGDQAQAAVCAFNLAHAYVCVPALYDLDEAERWCWRSLEFHEAHDVLGRGKCYHELAVITYARLSDARRAGGRAPGLIQQANAAAGYCELALEALPETAVQDIASCHNMLGLLLDLTGDLDRAIAHWHQGIRRFDEAGDRFNAGKARRNVAAALAARRRFANAFEYARAALRDLESYGDGAADQVELTRRLIAQIEAVMAKSPGS